MIHEEVEDLNKAKKKILYLLKLKYNSDEISENNSVSQTDSNAERGMQNIIRDLNSSISIMTQMIPSTKRGAKKPFKPMFRTQQILLTFLNLSLTLENTFKSININFKNIIDTIGYVEPKDIIIFKELVLRANNLYNELISVNIHKGELFFYQNNEDNDFSPLYNRFDVIEDEIDKIREYYEKVTQTYNYKGSNVDNSFKFKNMKSNNNFKFNTIDDDDD